MNRPGEQRDISVYVHVPFCLSKCAYCDFTSSAGSTDAERLAFVAAIRGAFRDPRLLEIFAGNRVPTVYFGGGTPTLLAESLPSLVDTVLGALPLAENAEVTVETNPETTSERLVHELLGVGVNRFSLGVQSFDDAVLATLGRCHDAESARRAARVLKESGAPFSVDLICGVPEQTIGSWMSTCIEAIDTQAGHASVYPLSIEEGTPMARAIERGDLREPRSDVAAEMMLAAEELLVAAGFERYEVASYARDGQRSRHNSGYWLGTPYVGVGPSAASMLPGDLAAVLGPGWGLAGREARVRFTMQDSFERFVADPLPAEAPDELEVLSAAEALREDAMLGLRMSDGITADLASRAGVEPVLEELAQGGLVRFDQETGRWTTTQRGWLLGNEVFGRVWTAE